MLIVFEGHDGTGTTTMTLRTAGYLMENIPGIKVFKTQEPYDQDIKPTGNHVIDAVRFIADRKKHIEEVINPALDAGYIVVTDRFHLSTLAYQSFGNVLTPLTILEMHDAMGCLLPDDMLTIILDCHIGTAAARKRQQGETVGNSEIMLMCHARSVYQAIGDSENDRQFVVDTTGDFNETCAEIDQIIDEHVVSKYNKNI